MNLQPADPILEVQREMLERLTCARWVLNGSIPRGVSYYHPSGPAGLTPDVSIPTIAINPGDVTLVLASIVQVSASP